MKEIREILERLSTFAPDERAVLATVVDVRGSGYRLPGARMLILGNGDTFGMVSGGCLEADVLERARTVLSSGRSEVFVYDTTKDERSVFSLNMGCRGVIRILLESVGEGSRLIEALKLVRETRIRQGIGTLISAVPQTGFDLGGRVFGRAENEIDCDNLPAVFQDLPEFRLEFERFLSSETNYDIRSFELPNGIFEFAFEIIEPPLSLLLFGAGADAIPLTSIAIELGWNVSVFDHRPAYLTAERFPLASRLVPRGVSDEIPGLIADRRTAAVIMSHNYERDAEIIPTLLRSDAFYVGALGPKRRTEQILGELAAVGEYFSEQELAGLYAPAGLDIGADTPELIALSIISEIQSVIKDRDGRHLRDRKGSIYDRK